MKDFILQPYEYSGSVFNARAHAETRLEVGGKKRNFVLKIWDGVIYFKEPARAPIFAILDIFDDALAKDSIGLISRWQSEVSAGNFGAFISKRDFFAGLPVRGNFQILVRTDGLGWMREHFDTGWFDLPWEKPLSFSLWNDKALEAQIAAILPIVKASLLQRTIEPEIRETEKLHWIGGSFDEFQALVSAAVHLLLEPNFDDGAPLSLKFKSHSAFAKGDIEASWLKSACLNPQFNTVWQLLEQHFHYVGVQWSEGGEKVEMYARPRSERVFQAGLEEWGENWRGNWAPQRGSLSFEVPPSVSGEREMLRNWLQNKTSSEQLNQVGLL